MCREGAQQNEVKMELQGTAVMVTEPSVPSVPRHGVGLWAEPPGLTEGVSHHGTAASPMPLPRCSHRQRFLSSAVGEGRALASKPHLLTTPNDCSSRRE